MIVVEFGLGATLEIKDEEGGGGMKVLGLGVTVVRTGGAGALVEMMTGGRVVTGAGAVMVDFVTTGMEV